MIMYKNYEDLDKLIKQYPSIMLFYTDGSYKPPEHNKGRQKLPTYSFVVAKPNSDVIYPTKSDVVYTNAGTAVIEGISEESIIANRNVSGEYVAIIKALEYANKRRFRHIAIMYDLEQIEKVTSGESKINSRNIVSVWFSGMMHAHRATYANIDKIFLIKVKAHHQDKKYLLNSYADYLAKNAI